MKHPLSLTLLAWLAAMDPSLATHYDVYLLGGQSNGNGRADAAQLTPPLSQEQTDVRLYYLNNQDENSVLPEEQWINLAPGSGHGTTLYYTVEFGPEVSFGRTMADAKSTANIAIIKYTYGGSNLRSDWSASGARYATFVTTVQNALAALTTAGDTYELRGMLWQQGESDTSGPGADNYATNLTSLIARVRTDLNGGVAFPFVIGSLSDSQYSNITTVGSGPYKVRQAQEAVAVADTTVGIAISDGFGILPDGIHFDHTGQVALGQSHATQMLALDGAETSLIHHWTFDVDGADSAGTHDGTAEGDASITTGGGGKFGEAVKLDGDGDSIYVAQSSLPATNFSLTAWIYRETAGDYMQIAGTQNSGNNGAFLRVEPATDAATANNALFANLLPPASSQRVWGGTIPVNTWTHVAMTVSSTAGLQIFINGTSAGTDATATSHSVWDNFRIGARPDNGASSGFDGLIDDVAIFNGVLDSTQLASVIANGAANFNGVVEDTAPPEVSALTPENGDLTVAVDADLVINFNEKVRKGASGDIMIKENGGGGTIFETIPVTDARVVISESVVTISPSGTFTPTQRYYVQIAHGAIEDLSGNPWAGIADTDATSWNFAATEAGTSAGTTGVFDENADATNSLDIEIPASTLGTFKASVLAAYNDDLGGVIDWETGVTATPSVTSSANNSLTSVAAVYGAGAAKVVLVTFDRAMDLYTNAINNQVQALSRQGSWHNVLMAGGGNDPVGLAYTVTFSGADIVELGLAIPSRSTYGALGVDFRATATHGGGGSEVVDFTMGGTPGTGDTFLYFTAPASETITSVFVEYVDDNGQSLANGQRRPALDDLGFVVAAPSDTFATWIANPAFGLAPADQDFLDDPDGDGLANGLEAWLGTHPGEFNAGLAQVATDGTTTTFTHPQNENPLGALTGCYEWSPNLVDWYAGDGVGSPGGGTTVVISPDTVGTTTTVTATASEDLDRIFFRIGVREERPVRGFTYGPAE